MVVFQHPPTREVGPYRDGLPKAAKAHFFGATGTLRCLSQGWASVFLGGRLMEEEGFRRLL